MDSKLRDELLARLKSWSQKLTAEIGTDGVFLFGSLIYKDGAQFSATSDIDLVILFPPGMKDALARTQWLKQLRERKGALEAELIATLQRGDVGEPIASLVVATGLEVAANIHKDGAGNFFSVNQFLDVRDGTVHAGLAHAGERNLGERLLIECLRFA
jgi:predicted nucleotidyltransferase